MNKKFFIFLLSILFFSCTSANKFQVSNVENNYSYEYSDYYSASYIYLTNGRIENKENKGRIYLKIVVPKDNLIEIYSNRESLEIDGLVRSPGYLQYSGVLVIGKPKIIQDNKEYIRINKTEYGPVEYPVLKYYLEDKLDDNGFSIELGDVKIDNVIYKVPKIYLKRLK